LGTRFLNPPTLRLVGRQLEACEQLEQIAALGPQAVPQFRRDRTNRTRQIGRQLRGVVEHQIYNRPRIANVSPPFLRLRKYFCATALHLQFRPCIDGLIFQSSRHGNRRRPFPHPSRPGPRPLRRPARAGGPAATEDLPGRGASGHSPGRRRPQSAGFGPEGKRPVQFARAGCGDGPGPEGAERLEPGCQRRADPRPARDGEGPDREAQPPAWRGAWPPVRQRHGGGRPHALSGAMASAATARSGRSIPPSATRRTAGPSSTGAATTATSSASSSPPRKASS
jgi:hypothetical protein